MPSDVSLFEGLPVLVTGGAGFIGSHLTRALIRLGANVLVLDNLSHGSLDNLNAPDEGGVAEGGLGNRYAFLQGDLRNPQDCLAATRDRVVVFHLAALGSVPRSVEEPLLYNEVNITGTLNLLDAARQNKCRRVVYSASSAAYGDTPVLPKVETMLPDPRSPYSVTKLVGEHYCRVFSSVHGLSSVCLRYFNVFGPRQNPHSQYAAVIPAFIHALLNGRRPRIYGDGTQTRDFCYVDNVVSANLLAGSSDVLLAGETFNVACGQRSSLNEMLAILQEHLRVQIAPEYLPQRAGDVKDSLADIERAKLVLGYLPQVLFAEGLVKTLQACKKT